MSTGTGWTIEEVERARDMHARGNSWTIVGQKLNRHPENCRKRVGQLNRGIFKYSEDGRERIPSTAPPPVETDDPAHVTGCLKAGGFGRLPIPWREPIPVWRAA